MVTCQKCGANNEENNIFCLNCGEKLNNDPSSELKEKDNENKPSEIKDTSSSVLKVMGFSDLFKDANQIADEILNEFKDVEGLNEVINGILSLKDSEIYEKTYEDSKMKPEEDSAYIDTVDDLLALRQVKLVSEVLNEPPLYISFLTGVIIATHAQAIFELIRMVDYAYIQKKLDHKDTVREHALLERLMSLLDDFDKPGDFEKPDKEFYQKLKKIKWEKTGKKLYKKLSNLKFEVHLVIFGVRFYTAFGSGQDFALTFLAACNSINHDRDRILKEDMIIAYKTYLKLLNTDISKLEV
jgi:zinc-ribbon domain